MPVLVLLCFALQVLAMGELITAGKIKHWGVSNETTFGEHTAKKDNGGLASVVCGQSVR
jgi:aryl-alcohol dehydrogenase-like predicted oxidoreductase